MIRLPRLLIFLCFCVAKQLYAQDTHPNLPKTSFKNYGYKQPVLQSVSVYYQADSTGYRPKMVEIYTFNKNQQLQQKIVQILGRFASKTLYNYVYKAGLLDSINTIASAASFSSFNHFIYNNKKQLVRDVGTGKYIGYTNEYSYDANGKLTKMKFSHQTGTTFVTNFIYNNKGLDYVERHENGKDGSNKTKVYYYLDDKIFASGEVGSKKVVIHQDDFGELSLEVEGDIKEIVNAFRSDVAGQKSSPNPFLKNSKILFKTYDAQNMEGDWIKRYQIDNKNEFNSNKETYIFRKITYSDGKTSGDTNFDHLFQMRMKKKLNLK